LQIRNESLLKTNIKRILCLILSFLAASGLLAYSDDQSWLNNSLHITLKPKLTLIFTHEFRNEELTFMSPYLANIQGGFEYSLSENTHITLLYKRQNTKKTDYILNENRYTLEAGWKRGLGPKVNFDLRFRTEGRVYEDGRANNHFRLRLRLRFTAKVEFGNLSIRPFIAIEPFGDTLTNSVNQNRFYIGASFPLGQHSAFVLNYIRQDIKNKETIHILNSGFQLKF